MWNLTCNWYAVGGRAVLEFSSSPRIRVAFPEGHLSRPVSPRCTWPEFDDRVGLMRDKIPSYSR